MKQLVQKTLGRFGYGFRKLSKLKPFTPFVRTITFSDATFQFWIANPDAAKWYEPEHALQCGELHALRSLVKKGDRILEIGSHHGFTGMLLANFAGSDGSIYSVEAYPGNTLIAQAQLGLNRSINNLQFVNFAGSSTVGTVNIRPCHNSNVMDKSEDTIQVPAITGDALDEKNGPFNVLKMDVEGYEVEVLKGCTKLLSRAPKLALEIHRDPLRERGQTLTDILDLIKADCYEGEMVLHSENHEGKEVQPFNASAVLASPRANIFLRPKGSKSFKE
jgi:FkbM family methyltransferase